MKQTWHYIRSGICIVLAASQLMCPRWAYCSLCRSEGFPRTGYLIPGRDTPRAWSNTKSSWQTAVAAAAVSWSKMVQIWAKVIFHENGHVPKFQDMLFSRNKGPCGSVPQKVTFSELTLRELIHFYRDLKNQHFQKKKESWLYFTYQNPIVTENQNCPYGP